MLKTYKSVEIHSFFCYSFIVNERKMIMQGKKREFTNEEIQYIVTNWGKKSPHCLKKELNCSWNAVCRVAKEHGLPIPTSNNWTKEEVERLKKLSKDCHYTIIARMMNKSENAIYLKARKLGITLIQDRRNWTPEEEIKLKELWGTKSVEDIAKIMQRTCFSLKVKAVKMGLGPMIKNNYEVITISDICEILGVNREKISHTWVNLGLNLRKIKLTDNTSYYAVTWEDLINFLKNNQNEWDSRLLEKHMLGLEPDWLKEKRIRENSENPLWYRKWTEKEISIAESLFRAGKNYADIAKTLNRSEYAVAHLLRRKGYSYKLPQFWQGNEIKYIRENYENMTYEEMSEALERSEKAVRAKANELGYQRKLIKKNNLSQ